MKSEKSSSEGSPGSGNLSDHMAESAFDMSSILPFPQPGSRRDFLKKSDCDAQTPADAASLDVASADVASADVASYVSSMLAALETVAYRHDLRVLSLMLAMAREQADDDVARASQLPLRR